MCRSLLWLQSKQSSWFGGGGVGVGEGLEDILVRMDSRRMRMVNTVTRISAFIGRPNMEEESVDLLNEPEVNRSRYLPRQLQCECHRNTVSSW